VWIVVWWIRYADSKGKERREKVGRRSDAITLYNKRKTEALQRKKLPEKFRVKGITFRQLCDDALKYCADNNSAKSTYELQLKVDELLPVFGHMKAEEITKEEISSRRRQRSVTGRRQARTAGRLHSLSSSESE
jgi:hypothetical protein